MLLYFARLTCHIFPELNHQAILVLLHQLPRGADNLVDQRNQIRLVVREELGFRPI
jgi:hypothetical protein